MTLTALACLSLASVPAAGDVWTELQRPLPPMALVVEATPWGNTLSWQPPLANPGAPVDAYNVYRFVDGVRESLGSVGADTRTFQDPDVDLVNSTYAYYVTARSSAGESPPSNLAPPGYPWCKDVVGLAPLGEIKWECVLPLPVGPASLIIR